MLCTIHHEMRLAFASCARNHSIPKVAYRTLTTSPLLRARDRSDAGAIKSSTAQKSTKDPASSSDNTGLSPLKKGRLGSSRSNTTELVPRTPKPSALQSPRRSDLPARLLPKAQISPGLTLSPKERLQIEYETRRPPKAPEKIGRYGGIYNGWPNIWADTPKSSKNVS